MTSSQVESVLGITPAAANELMEKLTEREREVAELMAEGHANTLIARKLGITAVTLNGHRFYLQRKLHVESSVGVARVVISAKLGDLATHGR